MIAKSPSQLESIESTPGQAPEIKSIIDHGLQQIANGSLILATVLLFLNLFSALQSRNLISGSAVIILFVLTFIAAFVRSLSAGLRTWILIVAFVGTGILSEMIQGLGANGILYFFTAVVVAALLLPSRRWFWVFGFSATILIALAVIIGEGFIVPNGIMSEVNATLSWMSIVTIMLFLTYLLSSVVADVFSDFMALISGVQSGDQEISSRNKDLNLQVTTLQDQLDSRKFRMVAARQISREIAQQTNLDALLKESVELIRSQFGYYHTGIFLKDERNEFAVLKAATGDAGAEMLARKHQLRLREEGVVGYVVARGEVRIASDVELDSMHYKNPLLPQTRSEMAVPLRLGSQIIGALDLQSQNPDEFDTEDADVIQTIADTLASSIDKLGQIQVLKASLEDLEEKSREFTGRVWQTHLKGSRKKLNFRYAEAKAQPTEERARFYREAMSAGKPIVAPLTKEDASDKQGVILAVPIKLRDQVLGVLNIKYQGENLPVEMQALVNTAADRLALALENARLLEEIQERAEREHLVANISDKVRAASDIDSILKTTATELGRSLGVAEVRIQLKTAAAE